MSESPSPLRAAILAVGEAPPVEAAPLGVGAEHVAWESETVEAFLAAMAEGLAAPDMVLVPGGDPEALHALRGDPRVTLLPMYALGAAPPGITGWDGVVTAWDEDLAGQAVRLRARAAVDPSAEPLDSSRRAHGFARYLDSRGGGQLSDAAAFGVAAPRTLLAAWEEAGWLQIAEDGAIEVRAELHDAVRWSRLTDPAAPPVEQVEPVDVEEVVIETPDADAEEVSEVGDVAEVTGVVPEQPADEAPEAPDEDAAFPVELEVEEEGPWPIAPADPDPAPQPVVARRRRRWVLPAAAVLVFALVVSRAAADAGFWPWPEALRWLGPEAAADDTGWQPPRRSGPRLVLPEVDAGLLQRLAAGDPAFRGPQDSGPATEAPDGEAEATEPETDTPSESESESESTEPSTPTPGQVPERLRLLVDAVHGETPIRFPRARGAIEAWSVAIGDAIDAGQVIATLADPAVDAQEEELAAMRAAFEGARAAEAQRLENIWRRALTDAEAALDQAARAAEEAQRLLADREEVHARNLTLVEQGVLGYGEIRADWESVVAARADVERRDGEARAAAAHAEGLRATPPPPPVAAPAEVLLLARLERALSEARATQVLRAPVDGRLSGALPAPGDPLRRGDAVGAILGVQPEAGLARLPADTDEGRWLDARAWLEPAPGVHLPVYFSSASRAADGGWELRFAWPPGGPIGAELVLESR